RNVLAHEIYLQLFGVASTQAVPGYGRLHCAGEASPFPILAPTFILRHVVLILCAPTPAPTPTTFLENGRYAAAVAAGAEQVGAALDVPAQAHSASAPRACRMLASREIRRRCVGVGRFGGMWTNRSGMRRFRVGKQGGRDEGTRGNDAEKRVSQGEWECGGGLRIKSGGEKEPSWGCNRTLAARDVERQAPAGICSTLDPWSFEMAIFWDVRFPEEKGPSWGCNRTLAARDVERQAPAGILLHA
ncbi:hypothetical protein B0H14DRAFT_2728395, partial [Mycena olivaceomarginata]